MTFTVVKFTATGPVRFGRHDAASAIEQARNVLSSGERVKIIVPNGVAYEPDQFDLLAEFYADPGSGS